MPAPAATMVGRARALGTLVRIGNASTGAAYTLLGAYLGAGVPALSTSPVARAALVVLLVIASGNVVNDYRDAEADAIAKPERPIPSGRIARPVAGGLAVGLAVAALLVASTLAWPLIVVAAVTVGLSVAYSYRLKNVPLVGNATVGALCAAILAYGGYAAAATMSAAVVAATAMTFLFVFAQEVFYTVEDEDGDRRSRIATTATRWGVPTTLAIFKGLALVFMGAALAPWFTGHASDAYLVAIVVLTIVPTMGVVVLVSGQVSASTVALASRLTRLIWYTSMLAIVLLRGALP